MPANVGQRFAFRSLKNPSDRSGRRRPNAQRVLTGRRAANVLAVAGPRTFPPQRFIHEILKFLFRFDFAQQAARQHFVVIVNSNDSIARVDQTVRP